MSVCPKIGVLVIGGHFNEEAYMVYRTLREMDGVDVRLYTEAQGAVTKEEMELHLAAYSDYVRVPEVKAKKPPKNVKHWTHLGVKKHGGRW